MNMARKKINCGMISVRLTDRLSKNSEIKLEKLTHTGRQMVRDDLKAFLVELDKLDEADNG
jgi:hypothetical protein